MHSFDDQRLRYCDNGVAFLVNNADQRCKFSRARVVYYTILYCIQIYYSVPYCIILYYTILYCNISYYHSGPRKLATLVCGVDKKCNTVITVTEALIINAVHVWPE